MPPPARAAPRLYRDFLTPALHRRFTKAAGATFLVCHIEAIIIGEKDSLIWTWFPLGRAGVRTFLLLISVLAIFILRVAQSHVGVRTTSSPFHTSYQYLFRHDTYQTIFWHIFSAWWFSEVYVWSQPKSANLSWISEGKPYERPRLNERPIYLRSTLFMLALMQSAVHLYYDYDRLPLPALKSKSLEAEDGSAPYRSGPIDQLKSIVPSKLRGVVIRCLSLGLLGPLVYAMFVRRTAWAWSLWFAKIFWSLPRSAATPTTIPPFHYTLILRSVASGLELSILWETANAAFGAFTAQKPLKRGRPLTEDSRDPNGSLLTGLKARREIPKAFAFWELVYISQRLPTRRKTIFEEIDRQGGATWFQVLNACLDVVQEVNTRIMCAMNPPPAPAPPAQQVDLGNPQPLRRITNALKEGQIFSTLQRPASTSETFKEAVGSFAKSHGQSPQPQTRLPSLSPRVKRYIEQGVDRAMKPEKKHLFTKEAQQTLINTYLLMFLRSPIGAPFRQTLARQSAAIVLGKPHGDLGTTLDAIDVATRLAICSLTEDPYGRVQSDVATIIRVFTATCRNLETLKAALKPHWTDVEASDKGSRDISFVEADTVMQQLKECLRALMTDFGPYVEQLGLGLKEIRQSRELAGMYRAAG
ncbi:MAG: hypothetical protein M1817_003913 [Caeruleum heppii]|nr:MAG: hypothetical protein M1817_003913 [Caeruleum heppii]